MTKYKYLFVGNDIKNPDKYIKKLETGKVIRNFYIVALEDEQLKPHIISSYMFLQKHFRDKQYTVLALVKTKDEAFLYIKNLTQLSINKFNKIDYLDTLSNINEEDLNIFINTEEEAC